MKLEIMWHHSETRRHSNVTLNKCLNTFVASKSRNIFEFLNLEIHQWDSKHKALNQQKQVFYNLNQKPQATNLTDFKMHSFLKPIYYKSWRQVCVCESGDGAPPWKHHFLNLIV